MEPLDDGSAKIVKATNGGQHEMWKLAFRPPLVALIQCAIQGCYIIQQYITSGVETPYKEL